MSMFDELIREIHLNENPYVGFDRHRWAGTWYNDPGAARQMFKDAIDRIKPRLIVEVGSFVGESAIFMAKHVKAQKMDCAILCVDTWYAGFDHWKGAREKIQYHHGRPDFYEKFLANVIDYGCQDVIVPMASDSINAARILKWLGIRPQMLYIDASHEQGDVLSDYEVYWEILDSGGGMLVDDLTNHFPGVLHDYDTFLKLYHLTPVLTEGEKALVIKP